MADGKTHLRLRVRDVIQPRERRIEVLDPDGNVLGDLALSVSEIRWQATGQELGIVSIDIACERAAIDSIEAPGLNVNRTAV